MLAYPMYARCNIMVSALGYTQIELRLLVSKSRSSIWASSTILFLLQPFSSFFNHHHHHHQPHSPTVASPPPSLNHHHHLVVTLAHGHHSHLSPMPATSATRTLQHHVTNPMSGMGASSCHVTDSDMATKRQRMTLSSFIIVV